MGLKKRYSGSTFDAKVSNQNPLPNPDPANYKLLAHEQVGEHVIVKIKYPDCTNYEGVKILVYENFTLFKLLQQGQIDPHFSDNSFLHSPIARFEPTERGWRWAVRFCKDLT